MRASGWLLQVNWNHVCRLIDSRREDAMNLDRVALFWLVLNTLVVIALALEALWFVEH